MTVSAKKKISFHLLDPANVKKVKFVPKITRTPKKMITVITYALFARKKKYIYIPLENWNNVNTCKEWTHECSLYGNRGLYFYDDCNN